MRIRKTRLFSRCMRFSSEYLKESADFDTLKLKEWEPNEPEGDNPEDCLG